MPGLDLPALRRELAAAGDADRAAGQQRYMKSALPYYGLTAPELRLLLRAHLGAYAPGSREEWEHDVRTLWDEVTHREEWYAAIAIARHRAARSWQDPAALDLYRHLIVTGAWWDVVDEIASHLVGGVLASHRVQVTPVLRRWAVDNDLWLRRTAVLSQLRHGEETDLGLLTFAIDQNLTDGSFWLRKAIGWALRQHARTAPGWVREFVSAREELLSPLSQREALKHLR
ncbi:DNA alkylation repair protein [Nocardioides sp.]|uniref:DNA alkylation repair protein n=1 Tax=Nocardioides sp. TaxID=35761 RepID=UPI002ED58279